MRYLRDYPWKTRLVPLLGASFLPWLVLRPAYWPFPSIGDADTVFFQEFLNRMVWAVVSLCSIGVVDLLAVQAARCRKRDADEQAKVTLPHVFWSGLLATLLAKTFVDFVCAGRPLPAGSEQWFAFERWADIIALGALPVVFVVARRIGPPSKWPFVQSMTLQPPAG